MEVIGFHLTEDPPRNGSDPGRYEVGRLWDGRHVAERMPWELRFGALVELRAMPHEHGDVEVSLHYSAAERQPLEYREADRKTVSVARSSPDGRLPRSIYSAFELSLTIHSEDEIFMWAGLNGKIAEHLYRPIEMWRGLPVPNAPPPDL